jgi:tRNA threonylcarbamoyladenosine biosynthesis protein TsaB
VGSSLRRFDPGASLLLALESATSCVSVALVRGGEVVGETQVMGSRHHAETLLPQIDEVLDRAKLEIADVDAFAVSIGPGTFTSLRIGLSTVKGLAFASDRPVAAVSTLAAVAHAGAAGDDDDDAPRVALLDARRDEFYAGAFSGGDALAIREDLMPESLYTLGELTAALPERFVLVGEGASQLGETLRRDGFELPLAMCQERMPHARSVAALGTALLAQGEGMQAAALVPRYLRRAQAEEDRLRRENA